MTSLTGSLREVALQAKTLDLLLTTLGMVGIVLWLKSSFIFLLLITCLHPTSGLNSIFSMLYLLVDVVLGFALKQQIGLMKC